MRRILATLILLLAVGNLWSQAPDTIRIASDIRTLESRMQIQATGGKIALTDIFRAVSRYNGFDDSELRTALPAARVSLDGRMARWSMTAVNKVLDPCVHVQSDTDGLEITVDRESARRWMNRRKSEVRWAWDQVDWRRQTPNYGVKLLEEAATHDNADIVVLIHGLNSRPEDVAGFIPLVKRAGLVAATFRYPNDQPIDESSKLLATELRKLAVKYPERKVRLLAHSMGGLVARETVETDLDPGNVCQLIMVGTPNHGSALASVATFMDCYELCTSAHYRRTGVLIESVADGLGEATADLTPNSVFLDRLNSRVRNPNIHYTILLGTQGPVTPEEMREIRQTVREYSTSNRFTRFVSSKLNNALAELDEIVQGKGDGVVSCTRGRLAGVADIVKLPFSHAGVLSPNADGSRTAHTTILHRLKLPLE